MQPLIIVPYRDRADNLKEFIPAIKAYLPQAEIVVVEQCGTELFNKGSLINIGMLEAGGMGDYFMFHDVDLIPIKVDYSYPDKPTHVATELSQYDYKMPYPKYFGGCVLFTKDQFESVNGFSNKFNGWGCEDDSFFDSFAAKGIMIERRSGRFESLYHTRDYNPKDFGKNVATHREGRDFSEGVSTVEYDIQSVVVKEDYIHYKACLK